MNTKQAISHLKRLGWHVSKEGKNYRAHRIGCKKYCKSNNPAYSWHTFGMSEEDYDLYSPRELVKLAWGQSAAPRSNTAIKKAVKSGQKVERRIVRDVISTGDVDKIDEIFTDKLEDAWNFD